MPIHQELHEYLVEEPEQLQHHDPFHGREVGYTYHVKPTYEGHVGETTHGGLFDVAHGETFGKAHVKEDIFDPNQRSVHRDVTIEPLSIEEVDYHFD